MPFVESSLDLIEQAMLLPIFKNYTGSPFHTTSCLNIIALHLKPLHLLEVIFSLRVLKICPTNFNL